MEKNVLLDKDNDEILLKRLDIIKDDYVLTNQEADFIDTVINGTTDKDEDFFVSIQIDSNLDRDKVLTKLRESIIFREELLKKAGLLEDMKSLGITLRQMIFLKEFFLNVSDPNRASNAYRKAYDSHHMSDLGAKGSGSRMFAYLKSIGVIEKFQKRLESELDYSVGEHLYELSEIIQDCKKSGDHKTRLTAAKAKAEILGHYEKNKLGSKNNPIVSLSIEDYINKYTNTEEVKD